MLQEAFMLLMSSAFLMLKLGTGTGSFPKPLSSEEERIYVQKAAEGDMQARSRLIEHNLRLVAHIIKKYYTMTDEQDDLISIGTIGLIKGVSTYRPDKGVKLATYASRCIENAILSLRNKKRADRSSWPVCSLCIQLLPFRCLTAASTSSSFCAASQGRSCMYFSACSA